MAGAALMLALGALVGVRLAGGDVENVFQTETVKVRAKPGTTVISTLTVSAPARPTSDRPASSLDTVTVIVPTTVTTTQVITQTETVTVTEPVTSSGSTSSPAGFP